MPSARHPYFTDHPLAIAHLVSCDVCWFKTLNSVRIIISTESTLGCCDFGFFTFLVSRTAHPWYLRTKGFWNWQKIISTSSMTCDFFWLKPEIAFFGIISKFNFRNPFWRANFLCGESIAPRICTTCYNCCQAGAILSVILMGLSLEKRET